MRLGVAGNTNKRATKGRGVSGGVEGVRMLFFAFWFLVLGFVLIGSFAMVAVLRRKHVQDVRMCIRGVLVGGLIFIVGLVLLMWGIPNH